jgi:hypothetical protein
VSDDASSSSAHGARLVARLDSGAAADATYALIVSADGGEWTGIARVRAEDGDVGFGAWADDGPPSWTVVALRALLRSAWQKRRAGEPWPRRLARWRPTPAPSAESA